MVFYLKYRPAKIDELDSQDIRERLSKILASTMLPHAFLFAGPKGLGKTSAARIVAKSVNCTNRNPSTSIRHAQDKRSGFTPKVHPEGQERSAEPCGKCDSCIAIKKGTNMDVLEIDGASNRGIDEIRDLREKIRLAPVSSKKKVYIIDEVHMLTTEAFNALLKTLEEPPEHAIFVLCTTEPSKVPPTIISRCLHISFKSPTDEEMKRSFKRIVKGEGLNIDDEGLSSIVKLSDGSFRDGAKILEEVAINFGKRKVGRKNIEESFNVATIKGGVEAILANLSQKDVKKALAQVEELKKQKVDFRLFAEELLSFLHGLLMTQLQVSQESEYEKFLKQAKLDTRKLKKLIEIFSHSYSQIKFSPLPQIPIELGIIEYSLLDETKEVLEHSEISQANDGKMLNEIIEKINKQNRSIAAVLRGAKLGTDEDNRIILITSYKFHKERLDDPSVKTMIAKAYQEITGKNKTVEVSLSNV